MVTPSLHAATGQLKVATMLAREQDSIGVEEYRRWYYIIPYSPCSLPCVLKFILEASQQRVPNEFHCLSFHIGSQL